MLPQGPIATSNGNYFSNPLVQSTISTISNGAQAAIGNLIPDAVNGAASWIEDFSHLSLGSLGRMDQWVPVQSPIAQGVANDLRGIAAVGLALTPLTGASAISETSIMQGLVDSANASFAANPAAAAARLTIKELSAVQANPNLTPMFYGTALERQVAQMIQNTPGLADTFESLSKPGRAVPDFRSTVTGALFDITTNTPKSFADHLARPYGNGLNLLPYDRPSGFSF